MNNNYSLNRYSSFASSYNKKGINCDAKIDQDNTLSQLNNKIFNLEQNEKCYSALESKYKTVKNELVISNESKLRLEYDLKQKTEVTNKIISELQIEKEKLQKKLTEKKLTNCSLFNDNNTLYLEIEDMRKENESLQNQLNKRKDIINELSNDIELNKKENSQQESLLKQRENEYKQLDEMFNEQKRDIDILIHKNKSFNEKCNACMDDNKNLNCKLKSVQDTLSFKQKAIDAYNNDLIMLKENFETLSQTLNKTQNELLTLDNALTKEQKNNNELKYTIQQLNQNIKDKLNEIERLKKNHNQIVNENTKGLNDIEYYKSHILLLTQLNEKLTTELESVLDNDNKINIVLRQNDYIEGTLRNIKPEPGISINKIEESISNHYIPLNFQMQSM